MNIAQPSLGFALTPLNCARSFLLTGLFATRLATADPLQDYVQACESPFWQHLSTIAHPSPKEFLPLLEGAQSLADDSCSAFVERLSALPNRTPEERLALFSAQFWLLENLYH